jgi:HEAT repeat protein
MKLFAAVLASALFAVPAFSQGETRVPPPPPLPADEPAPDEETRRKIDALIGKLSSEDWDERAAAEKELEAIGRPAASALKNAMETAADPEVKVRAKRLLQKLGGANPSAELSDEQLEELLETLRSQDGVSWYGRNTKPYFYLYQLYERQEFSNALKDPKFAPRLAKSLGDESGNLKRNAAFLLGDMGNPDVAKDVIGLLKDSEPMTRAVAVYAAGRIGNAAVVDDVIKALLDEDKLVRQAAAAALEQLPSAASIEPLLTAMKDDDARIRFHAWYSLRSLTGQYFRFNAWSSAESRSAAVGQYAEWWSKNRSGFTPKPPRKPEKVSMEPGGARATEAK